LPANFPGLQHVFRQGDPNASPSPVDFFSPDTFNYLTLDVAADGSLMVDVWGIPSYQQNTFPQDAMYAGLIFSFEIGLAAAVPEPGSLAILATGLAGAAPFLRRRREFR
jgi:hypothetical protein